MIINQKKVAQVILSRREKAGEERQAPVQAEESQDPRHAVAQDLIMAVQSGSPQGVLEAFDALFAMSDEDAGEGDEASNPPTEA